MVTGANGDMGKVIVTELARCGATVVMLCRNPDQAELLQQEIRAETGNPSVEYLTADLSDQAAIRRMVDQFRERHGTIHVLVNNAGAHFRERRVSVDGIELHLAINFLGPLLLIRLLEPLLKASAPSRVVNVVSNSMADTRMLKLFGRPRPVALSLEDLQSERAFVPMAVYARSKLALLMCGYVLARRLSGSGVTVNALHPGLVGTGIIGDVAPPVAKPFLSLIKRFLLTPEQGADSAIHLATAPELAAVTSKYFIRKAEHRSPDASYDEALQERLWHAGSALTGMSA